MDSYSPPPAPAPRAKGRPARLVAGLAVAAALWLGGRQRLIAPPPSPWPVAAPVATAQPVAAVAPAREIQAPEASPEAAPRPPELDLVSAFSEPDAAMTEAGLASDGKLSPLLRRQRELEKLYFPHGETRRVMYGPPTATALAEGVGAKATCGCAQGVAGYSGATAGYSGVTAGYSGKTAGYSGVTAGYYGSAPVYGRAAGYYGKHPAYGRAAGYYGAHPAYGAPAAYSGVTAGYGGATAGYGQAPNSSCGR